ncbi:MAG: ABC transporter permease subunit, partial [Anaerolineae bacterium]
MGEFAAALRKNRTLIITLAVLLLLFLMAVEGMSTRDWVVTTLRGLSVGAVTFLVASGFSIILGLMDVLNLAHGTLYMIGAYVGWTMYVRPDSVVDLVTPVALLLAGFSLLPLWDYLLDRVRVAPSWRRVWPWLALVAAPLLAAVGLSKAPIALWDPKVYSNSPIVWTQAVETNTLAEQIVPAQFPPGTVPLLVWGAIFLGGTVLALAVAGLAHRHGGSAGRGPLPTRPIVTAAVLTVLALAISLVNTPLTDFFLGLNSTVLFFVAVAVATLVGAGLGALMEITLIRPLYERAFYQIMLTFGLA